MGCPEPGVSLLKSWWHRAMAQGWGWVGSLKAPHLLAQVQPGLVGSQLNALLRLGRQEAQGRGRGKRERVPMGWGGVLPSNHQAARCLGGILKELSRKAGPWRS